MDLRRGVEFPFPCRCRLGENHKKTRPLKGGVEFGDVVSWALPPLPRAGRDGRVCLINLCCFWRLGLLGGGTTAGGQLDEEIMALFGSRSL